MKVLIVHTQYQHPSGEEATIETQTSVLERLGHQVVLFARDNDDINVGNPIAQARTGLASVWSPRGRRDLATAIAAEQPDVVHVHNTFPTLSPSVYGAANAAGVPVVQHLQNPRLVCINPFLIREGVVCTDCVGRRVPWPGVVHRCYRGSATASLAAGAMQATHHALGTWARRIDVFLPVSDWLGDILTNAGAIPPGKVRVCPNAVDPDPGPRTPPGPGSPDGGYAFFAGRLAVEKGVDTLAAAAASVPELPIKIAGDGPERPALERRIAQGGLDHVELLGQLDRSTLFGLLQGARVLVTPSLADPNPVSIIEASAMGIPTIGSAAGGIPEEVVDGVTGYLVPPSDPAALAVALTDAAARPERLWAMGIAARQLYEERWAPAKFGERLLAAYETAAVNASAAGRKRGVGRVGRPRRLTPAETATRHAPPGP